MTKTIITTILFASFVTAHAWAQVTPAASETKGASANWPQFRGLHAAGVASGPAPTKWDGASGENIKWKTRIAGLGHSSPIIWGDRVFLTTSISGKADPVLRVGLYGAVAPVEDDTEHSWRVLCLDKNTGKVLWDKEAYRGVPKIKRHTKATHANSTPVTDGKHVVAFFGSEGLYCYDMDGNLQWKKDFGVLDAGWYVAPEAQWEYAGSPIIHKDMVIIQCDVQKDSFLAALNIKDGAEVWRTPRSDVPTWSTPTVYEGDGRTQLIVNGYKHIGAYDAMTGDEIWKLVGGGDIPVPTPIVAHDLIFITNAHGGKAPIYAIRTSATGDITPGKGKSRNEYMAWSHDRRGNYMQTPLVYGDELYGCRDNGMMSAFNARTGKRLWYQRLGSGSSGFTASPVAADGKVYFTSEEGDTSVFKAGVRSELLAENSIGEVCMATPAISDGNIFIRSQHHLFCIGK